MGWGRGGGRMGWGRGVVGWMGKRGGRMDGEEGW